MKKDKTLVGKARRAIKKVARIADSIKRRRRVKIAVPVSLTISKEL